MKLIKTMKIIIEKKQTRVAIPEAMVELFDINNKDSFNWYLEKKGNRIRLVGMLNKDDYRLNYFAKGKKGENGN